MFAKNKQFIILCFIIKKTKKPVATLVLAAALALCGLDQLGFSPPPQRSQDGTPPPLSPDEDRERQSKAVLSADTSVFLCLPSALQT